MTQQSPEELRARLDFETEFTAIQADEGKGVPENFFEKNPSNGMYASDTLEISYLGFTIGVSFMIRNYMTPKGQE